MTGFRGPSCLGRKATESCRQNPSSGSRAGNQLRLERCHGGGWEFSIGSSPNSPLSVFLLFPLRAYCRQDSLPAHSCRGRGGRPSPLPTPSRPRLGELLPASRSRQSRLGFPIVSQQAVQQLLQVLLSLLRPSSLLGHGSFLPNDRLRKILTRPPFSLQASSKLEIHGPYAFRRTGNFLKNWEPDLVWLPAQLLQKRTVIRSVTALRLVCRSW